MSTVAPTKPWLRRQGSATVTESLPKGTLDNTASTRSVTPNAGGTIGASLGTSGATASTDPANLGTGTALSGYSQNYGGYRSGPASYGIGSCGYGGYGGTNRYGASSSTANSEFFGPTADSLSKFNDVLALNSFLLDQIYNSSISVYDRLKHNLLWLFDLKDAIHRAQHSTSDFEKRDLRANVLKRMIVLCSIAALFLLWFVRSLQRRQREQMLSSWQKAFPRNSSL